MFVGAHRREMEFPGKSLETSGFFEEIVTRAMAERNSNKNTGENLRTQTV